MATATATAEERRARKIARERAEHERMRAASRADLAVLYMAHAMSPDMDVTLPEQSDGTRIRVRVWGAHRADGGVLVSHPIGGTRESVAGTRVADPLEWCERIERACALSFDADLAILRDHAVPEVRAAMRRGEHAARAGRRGI